MKECEELRVVHMFLREATMTPFKQTPNYPRFMELCMNTFHYVGLARAVKQTVDRLSQKVIQNAARAVATRIVTQCIHKLMRESLCSDREAVMRSKWVIKDYVEELSEMKMMQCIENVCKAKCKAIQKLQYTKMKFQQRLKQKLEEAH
jgi:hypothetical protein